MRSLADEVPFDIPDSWEWVRFGNIVANYDSKRRPVTKEQRKNEHGYYDYYGATGAIDRVDDYIFEGEYLMIGEDGGNFFTERDNAFIASGRFWANNHVHIVQPIVCDIHFLKHFLDSCNLPKMGLINGIAVPKLNQEHLNSILVPLPPLSEQAAIVAELSKYAPLLDEYQLAYSEIKLLNDSFPERLKKSILQEAVQGKLVPQDPSDEPAEALLGRIRAEKQQLIKEGKIKKDKHESIIFRRDNSHYEKLDGVERCIDDELPFEIPESWIWVRLIDICEYIQRGKSPKYSPIKKYPVIAQKCNQWSGFSIEKAQFIGPESIASYGKERFLQDNDLMWNSTGLGTLGRMAVYKSALNPYDLAVADSHVTVIRPLKEFISPQYLYYYFSNPTVQCVIEDQADGTTKQKELSATTVKAYFVPLPPYNEQLRIVNQIEAVLPLVVQA